MSATSTTAPARKSKTKTAPPEEYLDFVRRQVDLNMAKAAAHSELLRHIEEQQEPGEITPHTLHLSSDQWSYFHVEQTSIHELCNALMVQRGIRELREGAGDPQKLVAAREALAAAIEAENTTRAALADIDAGDG